MNFTSTIGVVSSIFTLISITTALHGRPDKARSAYTDKTSRKVEALSVYPARIIKALVNVIAGGIPSNLKVSSLANTCCFLVVSVPFNHTKGAGFVAVASFAWSYNCFFRDLRTSPAISSEAFRTVAGKTSRW